MVWIAVGVIADVESLNGILQRLYVGVWFTWTIVMAFKLFYLSQRNNQAPSTSIANEV